MQLTISRRLFLRNVSLLGAGLALAACQPVATQSGAASSGAASAAPDGEAITLTQMAWDKEGSDVMPAVAKAFEAQQDKIKIEVSASTFADYWTKLNTLYAAGSPPDVAFTHTAWMRTHVGLGVLTDLSSYVEATPDFPTDWIAPSLALFQYNGGRYGINYDFGVQGGWWNPGLFEKAGASGTPSVDWTWDNLREWGGQITADRAGNHPDAADFNPRDVATWAMSGMIGGWSNKMRPQMIAFGAELFNADSTACTITDPASIEFLQWYSDAINTWHLHPSSDLEQGVGNLFVAGNSAVTSAFPQLMQDIGDTFKWDVAPFPKGADSHPTLNVGGSAHSIPAKSAQPDAAWQWITYNTGDEAQNIWAQFGFLNARQSTVLLALEKNANVPPTFKEIFVDHAEDFGVPIWQHVNRAKVEQALNDEFQLVWLGQRTVQEAAEAAKPKVDALLQEGAA